MSEGGIGLPSVGTPPPAPFVTGLAFGEPGMERPSRGGPLARPPGTGGRRRGTGADMVPC